MHNWDMHYFSMLNDERKITALTNYDTQKGDSEVKWDLVHEESMSISLPVIINITKSAAKKIKLSHTLEKNIVYKLFATFIKSFL